jgi:hypothetical protein
MSTHTYVVEPVCIFSGVCIFSDKHAVSGLWIMIKLVLKADELGKFLKMMNIGPNAKRQWVRQAATIGGRSNGGDRRVSGVHGDVELRET